MRKLAYANSPRTGGLPSAYYEIAELAPHWIDKELRGFLPDDLRLEQRPLNETFDGSSMYLEGLFHLVVRKNYKQTAKHLWPLVSRITSAQFEPEERWQSLRWRNPDSGRNRQDFHDPTQLWADMKALASRSDDAWIPRAFEEDPVFSLLHLLVFPHRGGTARIRWSDMSLRKRCRR